jgi:hypothetical protein
MENNATTPRTARPAMAPLGSVFECTAHKPLLDVLDVLGAFDAVVVTVTVATDPDVVVDSPELEQPGDVVPLARILVAVKGSVKIKFRVGSALHAVSSPHHQSGLQEVALSFEYRVKDLPMIRLNLFKAER